MHTQLFWLKNQDTKHYIYQAVEWQQHLMGYQI